MRGRVLVVDDDHDMVDTLSDILELHGWTPIRAFDGSQAIAIAASEDLDAVLMDIQLPRVNGAEALRAIKARHPTLPVILITAVASPSLLSQVEREGALRVVRKPFDVRLILDLLDQTVV